MEVVLAHTNTDFDSLAAQLAVTKLYPGTRMVPGYPLAANIRGFLSLYRDSLPLVDLQYVDPSKVTHAFVVDCQHADRLDEVGRKLIAEEHVSYTVFDHHAVDPSGLVPGARQDSIVEPAGACTSIVVGKLMERGIKLQPFEATLLLIGIYEDSGCLTYAGTRSLDARCVAYLLDQGADLVQVNNFINPKLSDEQTELFQTLVKSIWSDTISGAKVIVAHATCSKYIEGVATLTRRLLEVNSADVAVSVVFMRDRVHIVCRSDQPSVNVRELARAFGGDGHPGAASAVSKESVDVVVEKVKDWLRKHARPEVRAGQIMSSPVRTIKEDVSMDEAGRIMLRYAQDGLVVVDRNELIGVVSRRDVDKALHHKLGHAPVRGFMSRPVITIDEDTPLSRIQELMVKNDIGRLPVLNDDGLLVGIVTRKELLDTLFGQHKEGRRMPTAITGQEQHLQLTQELERLDLPTRWLFKEIGEVAQSIGMAAYAVGGAVRDLVLGRPNFDLDFVIEGSAIYLAEALEKAYPGRFEVVAKHERFQTATIAFRADKRREVDLSTARIEFYDYPAALPTVEASVLEQDLFRRDFTINALALCINPEQHGEVVDFFNGVGDIASKLIRVLHQFSFIEDPTRIIRAVRFAARLGFTLEEKTREQATRAIAMGIFDELGGFRLKEELRLILEAPERLKALDLLNDLGGDLRYLAKNLHYDKHVRVILRRAERLLQRNPIKHAWIVYLGLLLSPLTPEHAGQVMERLYLANDEREWILSGLSIAGEFVQHNGKNPSASEIYLRLHGHSDESLAIAACLAPPGSPTRRWIKLYLDQLRHVSLSISGNDLLSMGVPQGPRIKNVLQSVHQAKLDGLISNRSDELRLAEKILASKIEFD